MQSKWRINEVPKSVQVEKQENIWGKRRLNGKKYRKMSDRRFRRPIFQPFFYPSDFCLKSSIGALKIAQIFQKSIFPLFFAKILLVFLPFSFHFIQFSLPSPYFSFCGQISLRSIYPLGDAHPSPLPPSTVTRIRSFLCSPFFIFLVYLLRIFINNLTFIEKFHK